MKIFDCHAHYNDGRFDADRGELLSSLLSQDVVGIVEAGTDLASSERALTLAEQYPNLYAAVGIYPHETHLAPQDAMDHLERLLSHPKAVAIGEIGLDYYYDDSPKETQLRFLDAQLDLAKQTGYPVCIHDREAHGDCMDAVRRHRGVKGMFHSFSGSVEMVRELVKHGWYLSFSGPVTFANANKLKEAVQAVPPDRLLLETDSPYLTPVPLRGKRNCSDHIRYIAQVIADLRGMSVEALADQTVQNAKEFYRIG